MYRLFYTPHFQKRLDKLTKKDSNLGEKIKSVLKKLRDNPGNPILDSHKVDTRAYGKQWSSKVNGDIRLIWNYDQEQNLVIIMIDIGGHTGKHKVYK